MKVLVVDDSETHLLVTSSYLEKMGHEVFATTQPETCLDLFKRNSPDLVILDIVMEGIDGYECARQIRGFSDSEDNWIPIIFASSLFDDASIIKGIECGADDYIVKPFSETMLRAKVKAMSRIAVMRDKLVQSAMLLKKANNRLNYLSLTDRLTGIANRRAFELRYTQEWHAAEQNYSFLSVMMIDIDLFKHFNDEFGHIAGDRCLRKIAGYLDEILTRDKDEIFRYGGEEFIVILPETKKAKAIKIADKLCKGILTLKIPHSSTCDFDFMSISIGVSSVQVSKSFDRSQFIKISDEALYEAKNKGRNCVVYKDYSD